MLSERETDLVNRAIDGALSETEKPEFAALIKDSQEARDYNDGLAELASLLNSVPLAEPPADLQRRILSRVQLPRPRRWFTRSAGWMQGKPISYGFAAAAGLLIAVAYYEMAPGPHAETDYSTLVGTLARGEGLLGVVEYSHLDIDLPSVQGRVALSGSDDLRLLRFDVDSVDEAEFKVNLGNSGLSFGGFAQEAAASADTFRYSDNSLSVSDNGARRFTLILRDASADKSSAGVIEISVRQNGETLYQGVLRL